MVPTFSQWGSIANIFMYGRLSGIVTEQTNSKDGVAVITLPLGGSIKKQELGHDGFFLDL